MGGVLCDDIMSERSKLTLHSLKRATQKFLLKTKSYNSLLVTVVVQFTVKTTNSERAIYFLSLISCSMNKINSHMLLICKNFVLLILHEKKFFAPGNGEGRGG